MSKVVKKDPLVPVFKQLGADVGEILTLLRNKSNVGETPSATECPAPTVVEKEVIKYVDRPVEKIVEKVVHVPASNAYLKRFRVNADGFTWYAIPIPEEFKGKNGLIFIKEDGLEWNLAYTGVLVEDNAPKIGDLSGYTYSNTRSCEVVIALTGVDSELSVLTPVSGGLH